MKNQNYFINLLMFASMFVFSWGFSEIRYNYEDALAILNEYSEMVKIYEDELDGSQLSEKSKARISAASANIQVKLESGNHRIENSLNTNSLLMVLGLALVLFFDYLNKKLYKNSNTGL